MSNEKQNMEPVKSNSHRDTTIITSSFFQPKPTVNHPGDVYEREADSMAEHVMRMTIPSSNGPSFFKAAQSIIQRKCPHCEEEEKLHRKESSNTEVREISSLESPKIQRQAAASTNVYICSKDLDTSPIGKHAFFRVGRPERGNTTYSLQPVNQHLLDPNDLDRGERERNGDAEERYGVGCWQGVPDVNWSSDLNATGECELSSISLSDLVREHDAYPVGHYCTLGPNSNTYVGHIGRNCGVSNVDPPGWTPGIDDQPPPSGTFAPSRKYTLIAGCTTKECGHSM